MAWERVPAPLVQNQVQATRAEVVRIRPPPPTDATPNFRLFKPTRVRNRVQGGSGEGGTSQKATEKTLNLLVDMEAMRWIYQAGCVGPNSVPLVSVAPRQVLTLPFRTGGGLFGQTVDLGAGSSSSDYIPALLHLLSTMLPPLPTAGCRNGTDFSA